MKKPATVQELEDLGRVRLSKHFFMRDFLYSEISQIEGIPNIPDYPDRAIEAGRGLCEQLLEPLQERFGRIVIRSAYLAPAVNAKTSSPNLLKTFSLPTSPNRLYALKPRLSATLAPSRVSSTLRNCLRILFS